MAGIIVAFVVGLVVAGLITLWMARTRMIQTFEVAAPFERVCEEIEGSILSVKGWAIPVPMWNKHKAVSKHFPYNNLKGVKVFFSCNAEYANMIVDRHHHLSGIMPCSWAVYETNDSRVFVSKMNIPMFAWVFSGNVIGRTMAKVAREEAQMKKTLLERVRKPAEKTP